MFRPCIDLHQGKVKQIIGATLESPMGPVVRFEGSKPAAWYAELYRRDGLCGGHLIMLGPGNEQAAREALAAYPGGLQVGGGIRPDNALEWLASGASHVIVTSYLFDDNGRLRWDRVEEMAKLVSPEKLVIDLSCRKIETKYYVASRRWQGLTKLELTDTILLELSPYCAEFLVHAVDREGTQSGPDLELVKFLADNSPLPVTYAGGARTLQDLITITEITNNRVDLTIGSALDIFGGSGVRYRECVEFNRRLATAGGRPL